MSPNQLSMFIPSRRISRGCGRFRGLGGRLGSSCLCSFSDPDKPAPNPAYSHDKRFVIIGHDYLPQLGKAYAAAWEQGAKNSKPAEASRFHWTRCRKAWKSNRVQLYDRMLTPEFAKIVAENIKDEDLTTAERTAWLRPGEVCRSASGIRRLDSSISWSRSTVAFLRRNASADGNSLSVGNAIRHRLHNNTRTRDTLVRYVWKSIAGRRR